MRAHLMLTFPPRPAKSMTAREREKPAQHTHTHTHPSPHHQAHTTLPCSGALHGARAHDSHGPCGATDVLPSWIPAGVPASTHCSQSSSQFVPPQAGVSIRPLRHGKRDGTSDRERAIVLGRHRNHRASFIVHRSFFFYYYAAALAPFSS